MENQLFDWLEWDELDVGHFLFMNCTLKQDIGALEKGMLVDSISVNYQNGELIVFDREGNELTWVQLALIVVEDN